MDDNRDIVLADDEIKQLRLGATPDGTLCVLTPGGYIPIGQCEPRYASLLRASASQYQVLATVQKLLVTFLETADLIQEIAIADQLQRITASIDLVLKFSRNEA